jgi:DNA topoisomerase-1
MYHEMPPVANSRYVSIIWTMETRLVVVESPAKAKTIKNILGAGYYIVATLGHLRDLPRDSLGINVERGFAPKWVISPKRRAVVKRLRDAARFCDEVYLATDPDREGEAIAWHALQMLKLPKAARVYRIAFHEITPAAIRAALQNKGQISKDLVQAQETRRVLDRLVGYQISPLLWSHVKGEKALSAGRVQTVALRLVVDREREIDAFEPEEYWTVEALLAQQIPEPSPFVARLHRIGSSKPNLKRRSDVKVVLQALEGAAFWVDSIKVRRQEVRPPAPFITSTLQQEASRRLRLTPKRTMALAQQLYEGVELDGEGTVGLITYIRTDSTHVAAEAQAAAREAIQEYFGPDYLPLRPPTFPNRSKTAQEAHEAIRPTDVWRTPKQLRTVLNGQLDALYSLIWRRFVASQMASAVFEVTTILIPTGRSSHVERLPYLFQAQGRVRLFDGFLRVYEKADADQDSEPAKILPSLYKGEDLDLLDLHATQEWTKPPSRFSEASLIKELERRGIGRPSTFASMVNLIQQRKYVYSEERLLHPTPLGLTACDLLVGQFPRIFGYEFTVWMEQALDDIANGRRGRLETLKRFWDELDPALEAAQLQMPTVRVQPDPVNKNTAVRKDRAVGKCPQCGARMESRLDRIGLFAGCSRYPDCRCVQR